MKLTVVIDSDNDSLRGGSGPSEAARLLRVAADRVQRGVTVDDLRDFNGNRVGSFTLSPTST